MANRVYTPAQVRELDRIAMDEQDIPGYELMTRAGTACYEAIRARYPRAQRWLILCGSGNNAGDGYVVARLAHEDGIEVRLVALADPDELDGDAAEAWRDYQSQGGEYVLWDGAPDFRGVDLVVDALLGTGLERPLRGEYLDAVTAANESELPLVAVDVPTGLHGATGAILGAAIEAELTVTFVGLKQGLYLGDGPECAGEIVYDDLGIEPIDSSVVEPSLEIFSARTAEDMLPQRSRTAHKGDHGHVVVAGGNDGMAGAVRLAGEAALRAGAGLVSAATRPGHVTALVAGCPEIMAHAIAADADLEPLLARADVIALGPGLGSDDWAQALFRRALATDTPLVVDADALNLLAAQPVKRGDWILTPHPGEAARLLGSDTRAVQADRPAAVRALARKYGGTVILKGYGTLVASAQLARPWLITTGNPGMGTAGMGDVLTGLTAALLAQFGDDELMADIAALAAWVHGSAGDRAARQGERGLIASDLLRELRACLNP